MVSIVGNGCDVMVALTARPSGDKRENFEKTRPPAMRIRSITVPVTDGPRATSQRQRTIRHRQCPGADRREQQQRGYRTIKPRVYRRRIVVAMATSMFRSSDSDSATRRRITIVEFQAMNTAAGTLPGGITASAYNRATGVITLLGSSALPTIRRRSGDHVQQSERLTSLANRKINVIATDGTQHEQYGNGDSWHQRAPTLDLDANDSTTTGRVLHHLHRWRRRVGPAATWTSA